MKVLVLGTSFLPNYGGPARSVPRLADALVEQGVEVGLWSADGSGADTPFLKESSQVQLLSGTLMDTLSIFPNPDGIHDNGIWLPHNHKVASLSKRFGIPRVVSTRGMLSQWAWRHKRFKKRIAWSLYQRADLQAAAALHVTSSSERSDIKSLGLGVPIKEIPNGVIVPTTKRATATAKAQLRRAIFVGRIYPVKGLIMLVEAWAKIRPSGWEMVIVGPDEAGHRQEVQKCVKKHGLSGFFKFTGPLQGEEKRYELLNADLFILSSFTENFGMAAAEALAHGLPVLATQGTPWKSLVDRDCGWWVPTTVEGIADGLLQATSCDANELAGKGQRGRSFVEEKFGWDRITKKILACYESVVF